MARGGFRIHSRMTGDRELRLKLAKIVAKNPAEMERALEREGDIEMTEMIERTPLLMGDLRRTAVRFPARRTKSTVSVLIRMGGPAAPYAIIQHVNTAFVHPRGGEARYMASVVNEARKFMLGRIATGFNVKP